MVTGSRRRWPLLWGGAGIGLPSLKKLADHRELGWPDKIWVTFGNHFFGGGRWLFKWIEKNLKKWGIQGWAATAGSFLPGTKEAPFASQ